MSSFRSPMHETLRALGWFQFRNLVAAALRKQGYAVESIQRNPEALNDIDLILHRDGTTTAVRCSHGDAWRVGIRLLRRFAEARIAAGIPSGLLVSAGGFTDEVYDLAAAYQVIPWGIPEVVKLLEDTAAAEDPALISWLLDERRLCPYCETDLTAHLHPATPQPGARCLECPNITRCAHTLGVWRDHERLRRFLALAIRPRPGQPSDAPPHTQIAPATLRMVVCSREAAQSPTRFEPTHVVSLLDPGSELVGLRPPWLAPANHYIGLFCDIRDPATPEAPTESDLRSVIAWLEPLCAQESRARFLIHCQAGVGRSPAIGYVAWAMHLGPGREQEAWERMLESCVKRWVVPNSLVVRHADRLLGRNGALCHPLNRWSLALPWSRFR